MFKRSKMLRRNVLLAAVGGVILAMTGFLSGVAAAEFPTKPITIIVAYGAGGGTDAFMRAIAEPVSKELGQPVLVQNKPGAGGGVAAMTLKGATPDGYTLIATGSLTYTFEPQVQTTQYDVDDFAHIAVMSQFQEGLFTNPKRPYTSMKDLIARAKAENRNIIYASLYQLDRHIFSYVGKKEGVTFIPLPTKGGSGVVRAVLADQVDFGVSGGSFGPHAESGAVRLIGAMTADRLERFPDIPSMNDNGWMVGSQNYLMVSAPKGTPRDVIAKLAAAFERGTKDEKVQRIVDKRYMRNIYFGANDVDEALAKQKQMFADMLEAIK